MADDFKANARTTGTVAVGGSATGEIEKRSDVDWFAVELVAGRTYVIDLEGAPSGGGTLGNAMLRGLYDAEGQRIAGTRNDDGGKGADARLTFTATESGTHYIAARSSGPDTGSYTVRVTAADDFTADTGAAGTRRGRAAAPPASSRRGTTSTGSPSSWWPARPTSSTCKGRLVAAARWAMPCCAGSTTPRASASPGPATTTAARAPTPG